MSVFQYSGGPAAFLGALASGYDKGVQEKIERAATQANTANTQAVQGNLVASQVQQFIDTHPNVTYQQAYDYVTASHGGADQNVPMPAPTLGPVQGPPALPPPPVPGSPPNATSAATGLPVFLPSSPLGRGNGSGNLGLPPPAAQLQGSGSGNLGMTVPSGPSTPALSAPVQGPPMRGSMPTNIQGPPALVAPTIPRPALVAPPPPPPAPVTSSTPPTAPVPAPAMMSAVPGATDASTAPAISSLPWQQQPASNWAGQNLQQLIWGARMAPQMAKIEALKGRYGDQAVQAFLQQASKYSTDPAAQMKLAQLYDERSGTTDFTDAIAGGTGSTDKAQYDAGRLALDKEHQDAYSGLINARIPDILAQAGLTRAKTGLVDAQTGVVIPEAEAKIRLEGATANVLGIRAEDMPGLDASTIAYKSALGAAATSNAASTAENADTNRYNAQSRAALDNANITRLATQNNLTEAEIIKTGESNPGFAPTLRALSDAQDRLARIPNEQYASSADRATAMKAAQHDVNYLSTQLNGLLPRQAPGGALPAPVAKEAPVAIPPPPGPHSSARAPGVPVLPGFSNPAPSTSPVVLTGTVNGQSVSFHAPTSSQEFLALTPAKQAAYRQWFAQQKKK